MLFKSKNLLTASLLLLCFYSCKTTDKKEEDSVAEFQNTDAGNARSIAFSTAFPDTLISVESGNTGGGQTQEFNADSAALRHMPAREDNTDWYKLVTPVDTGLAFTITPKNASEEIDFVLFRASDENISASLSEGKLNALRSNFNKTSGNGSTGLACNPKLSYHGADGDAMSRAFVIRKNQTYYLVVNAPAGKSAGYDLQFHACSSADGNLAAFEGDPQNPESENSIGIADTIGTESGTGAGSGGDAAGASGAAGGKYGSGSEDGAGGNGGDAAGGAAGGKYGSGGKGGAGGKGGDAAAGAAGGKYGSGGKGGAGGKYGSGGKGGAGGKGGYASGGAGKGSKSKGTRSKAGKEQALKYVVGKQETLYSIAFKMGMTVEELMALNGMKDTNIYPGQKIKVKGRNLSQKEIDAIVAGSKSIKPSQPKSGSTTDPKEIARIKAEKAAAEEARKKVLAEEARKKALAEEARKKAIAEEQKANALAQAGKAGDAKDGQRAGEIEAMKGKSAETISSRNPNFNPTPNFPVNNPKVTQGVETSNSLAPADKSFYVYCNVTSGVNKNPVAGVLQVVDLKKKELVYNVQANRTQGVPLFNAGGKLKLFICDIFGYKKQDFDLNLDNIINDSTSQQVQIVDDTIVINFELRRLVKGDVAVAYNIFFYDDASVMLPKSTYELDQLLELMQENKKIRVKIHGHTNTSKLGKILYLDRNDKNFFRFTAKNKETFGPAKMLSKKRAETIKMYLESKKVTEDRIETEGHGGSQMLYPNNHPLSFKNKRVEVEILEDK